MGRKILFITTDQQRYDALGCNGGTIARTPNIDALSRDGMHTTFCGCARSKVMPSRLRASMFGVRAIVPPLQP
ncbi:MAG: hypothetical protein EB089_02200, partial [Acidimicrobiia bacterium]|nr:hypothetical protein [Acidimicrobiia bacterium]